MAPPAEWPVMSKELSHREGSSSSNDRSRAATGWIILRATDRKPEWQRLPGSSCFARRRKLEIPSFFMREDRNVRFSWREVWWSLRENYKARQEPNLGLLPNP